eukprot:11523568-Alexandrium_andersonii.AAC.1
MRAGSLPVPCAKGRWADDVWLRPQHGRLGAGRKCAVYALAQVKPRACWHALAQDCGRPPPLFERGHGAGGALRA